MRTALFALQCQASQPSFAQYENRSNSRNEPCFSRRSSLLLGTRSSIPLQVTAYCTLGNGAGRQTATFSVSILFNLLCLQQYFAWLQYLCVAEQMMCWVYTALQMQLPSLRQTGSGASEPKALKIKSQMLLGTFICYMLRFCVQGVIWARLVQVLCLWYRACEENV